MYRTLRSIVVELACQLPDWVFLAAGLTIVTAALLVPPYLEVRQLQWQRGLQAKQYQTMAQQTQDYRTVLRALDAHDPVLLERLAYPYLHLKPAGATPLLVSGPGAPADRFAPVDVWLQRPMPRVGVDYPAYAPLEAPWLRFFMGTLRVPAMKVGIILVFLSLIPVSRPRGLRRSGDSGGSGGSGGTAAPLASAAGPGTQGVLDMNTTAAITPDPAPAPQPVATTGATPNAPEPAPAASQLTFAHFADSATA
jgi:hypothetical protein